MFSSQWLSPKEFVGHIWERVAFLGRYGGFGLQEILALDNVDASTLCEAVGKLLEDESKSPRGSVSSGG